MEIKFSVDMFTDFNFSIIDKSIIEMYIIPSEMRKEEDEEIASGEFGRRRELTEASPDYLNFTWNVTNFEDDTLEISMFFINPLVISEYEIQDELYIYFTEDATSMFYSEDSTPTSKNFLETTYIKKRIIGQIENNAINRSIKTTSEVGLINIEAFFVFSIVLNLMFNDLILNFMLAMLRAL